jgi:hypothetical protein
VGDIAFIKSVKAQFAGDKRYILGNIQENPKAQMFLMNLRIRR